MHWLQFILFLFVSYSLCEVLGKETNPKPFFVVQKTTTFKNRPISYNATFKIHYPANRVCNECELLLFTSIDGFNLSKTENHEARAIYIGNDVFNIKISYQTFHIGIKHTAIVVYSTNSTNTSEMRSIFSNCKHILHTGVGLNVGRSITFTLSTANNSVFDIFPSFCSWPGEFRKLRLSIDNAASFSNVRYYVPGSVIENPLSRQVNYLLYIGDFIEENMWKSNFDFLFQNGVMPETVIVEIHDAFCGYVHSNQQITVFTNLTTYQDSEYKCFNTSLLDFILEIALQGVFQDLSLIPVGRDKMAVMGFSYGGLVACTFAYLNSSVFSKGYCGSAEFWYNNKLFLNFVKSFEPSNTIKLYIDYSAKDSADVINGVSEVYSNLLSRKEFNLGVNLMLAKYSNSLDTMQLSNWQNHMVIALTFLYNDGKTIGTSAQGSIILYADSNKPHTFGVTFIIPSFRLSQVGGAVPIN